MWMQLRGTRQLTTDTEPLKEFHEWGMGVWGGRDNVTGNYYWEAQRRVMFSLAMNYYAPWCPMWLLLMGGTQLRRVPLYSQALVFSLLPLLSALDDTRYALNRRSVAPTRVPSYFLERCALQYHSGIVFLDMVVSAHYP